MLFEKMVAPLGSENDQEAEKSTAVSTVLTDDQGVESVSASDDVVFGLEEVESDHAEASADVGEDWTVEYHYTEVTVSALPLSPGAAGDDEVDVVKTMSPSTTDQSVADMPPASVDSDEEVLLVSYTASATITIELGDYTIEVDATVGASGETARWEYSTTEIGERPDEFIFVTQTEVGPGSAMVSIDLMVIEDDMMVMAGLQLSADQNGAAVMTAWSMASDSEVSPVIMVAHELTETIYSGADTFLF